MDEKNDRFHFRRKKRGAYIDHGSIWSEIKAVYARIQHDKCAYCERALPDRNRGKVEHDVEHFRPKSSVKAWPGGKHAPKISFNFSLGGNSDQGYYLLAYHPFNYAISCKSCNTRKSNFFPVAGNRRTDAESPAKASAEKPYLIYPLGQLDQDPESILTFVGTIPKPIDSAGNGYRRARVIIDFFELDVREELIRQRCEQISTLFLAAELELSGNMQQKEFARTKIKYLTSPPSSHASCCRAFAGILKSNRTLAAKIANASNDYLSTQS